MTQYANVPEKGQKGKLPKIFVLDTNIILHDYKAIRHFQENDIVIPVAVLEELDKFKKGSDALSFNARGFMREIDKLSDRRMFGKEGIPIGKHLGNLKVELYHPFPEELRNCFQDDTQDHRILATAMWVKASNPGRFVALVTKDINLRMKAKAVGMEAQDYLTDRIEESRVEYTQNEVTVISDLPQAKVQSLAYGQEGLDYRDVCKEEPKANQLYKFRWEKGDNSYCTCARYNAASRRIVLVKDRHAYGISPRNDEQRFALDACLNPDIKLVSLTGGAGTGKTLLALAAALETEHDYDQIILSRPTVILGNQEIGFLPGDQKSKMGPFVQPLMDNLSVIRGCFRQGSKQAARIDAMLKDEKLLISPLAYIRGRSLGKVYFIIDEAQNLTPHEVKTIITRAGEGTKMVFTGDIFQIDQPYLDMYSNGLTHLGEKMSGQQLFEHINLKKGERSELSDIASRLL
ncbi:MAG: PhoH family protein [Bacteroidetes bacterium]|uniref:PhoH family protein n=1 Tax=Candidatus Cryptobacteroides excrementipullorum TaxID=2840761 RepID=A0A9D9IWU1_9BACT|nr:PhoH family protein [Candidatus Cryptobacteroides excrementipullorum]